MYNFSENRVVDAFELEGLESVVVNGEEYADFDENGRADIVPLREATIIGHQAMPEPVKNEGNWLSRLRDRTSSWSEENIRGPVSSWTDSNIRQPTTGWIDDNIRQPVTTATQPVRDFTEEFSAAIEPLVEDNAKLMRSTVGAYYQGLAEYGLVGSGLGSGNLGKVYSGVPTLRSAYVTEVQGLSSISYQMRISGNSPEKIARTLHSLRRELGVKYKSLTPKDMLEKIYQRNLNKYGDKLGPSIEYLRAQGKSWDDIIESATRTGGKDLGF